MALLATDLKEDSVSLKMYYFQLIRCLQKDEGKTKWKRKGKIKRDEMKMKNLPYKVDMKLIGLVCLMGLWFVKEDEVPIDRNGSDKF